MKKFFIIPLMFVLAACGEYHTTVGNLQTPGAATLEGKVVQGKTHSLYLQDATGNVKLDTRDISKGAPKLCAGDIVSVSGYLENDGDFAVKDVAIIEKAHHHCMKHKHKMVAKDAKAPKDAKKDEKKDDKAAK